MSIAWETYCGVTRVNKALVQLSGAPWLFGAQNRGRIFAFWRESHPHFYDGQVHVMTSWEIRRFETDDAVSIGNMCRTNLLVFYAGRALVCVHRRKSIFPEVRPSHVRREHFWGELLRHQHSTELSRLR
jgi:hypothetical protein